MVRMFLHRSALFALALGAALAAVPALANTGQALSAGVVEQANVALKNALPHGSVAQVPPVSQQPVGGPQQTGLPTGFTYTLDFSVSQPLGNVGTKSSVFLPGGMDAVAAYGFNPTTRLVVSYYELQHYPVGFNTGTVPFYLQGLPNALGCVDLSGGASGNCAPIASPIDVSTKDRFTLINFEKLIRVKLGGGRTLPIVISPTYLARTSKIAASTSNDDVVAFERNGLPYFGIHTRTAQVESLAFTLPFLKTSKMFGTFTIAPTWLVHTAGLNRENHAQLYQILYLEYTPNDKTTFFFEPQASRDYLPTDPYAQHLNALFLGASERVGKIGFVQVIFNTGGPSNYSPYGVSALTCQQAGNCANTTVPTVGGLKATQFQLQFGIGSPSVLPF